MDAIELLLSKLPHLRYLILHGNANVDIANEHRWEILAMNLITYNFKFRIEIKQGLFTVPYFADDVIILPFHPPLYSTTPNDKLCYEHVTHISLLDMPKDSLHYFNHVKALELQSLISLEIRQTKIDLSRVEHLILHSSINPSFAILIPNVMPRLNKISLLDNMKDFLKNTHNLQPLIHI
ncbi:unnamed protein product [Rotaria sp. Silwood2]|nr:unnamed protein product [Rotaria sp. Silwood2]CAF3320382.1 unnamed protein product [Rotaria sp. Silwood2]CAF3457464.1 unnamed protein product [Rotaria sp. Silwood2]CAF4109581.1 unnamed protein product [Rotaria sp. Silwood2]CAF4137047.1 unnamed protein product [Rotaria sp. Silwood2]